jgi:hypothetical protein
MGGCFLKIFYRNRLLMGVGRMQSAFFVCRRAVDSDTL